jgi:prolyl oligopeptidase
VKIQMKNLGKTVLMFTTVLSTALAAGLITPASAATPEPDPYLWLEEVTGEKAIEWVKAENAKTEAVLSAHPKFAAIRDKSLAILEFFYNFWQDAANPRGIWRRTSLAEYKKAQPNWEVVFDLDAHAKLEKESWVWKGATFLYPSYDRAMVSTSRGGADATVWREFDVIKKEFVAGGFSLPEAKGSLAWIDRDTLFVQTDFGAGSMTASGYPRIVKEWKRGTPLSAAKTVFEGKESDISVTGLVNQDKGYAARQYVLQGLTFYTSKTFVRDAKTGVLTAIDVPADATLGRVRNWMLVSLKSDWKVADVSYPSGALIAINETSFMAGKRNFDVLFKPTARRSLAGYTATKSAIIVNELDNVKSKLVEWRHSNGAWTSTKIAHGGNVTLSATAVDSDTSDDYFFTQTDYLTPPTLNLGTVGSTKAEKLKALPAFFDATPYQTTQFEATSKDGEKIPYFVVMAKNAKFDGSNPTLLYGYGGFQASMLPAYSGTTGAAWLENGGVYVVANIRGGGEFGPRWHQAGLKQNRQRIYDDFIAVGEDLSAKKITSPKHLAIYGGSNGGLLVGAVMVQRPDLFKAVVCAVPLLDMQRYHKLLAGASWVAEYGDPDQPDQWEYISKYSPYQNLKPGVKYPSVLFTTSMRDDRVHPGHARKMMAKMQALGSPVQYYENMEGGHAGSANNAQVAYRTALMYSFLLSELK